MLTNSPASPAGEASDLQLQQGESSNLAADHTSSVPASSPLPTHLRAWQWALAPLLAFLAYATVLRVGFLQDDFIWLRDAPGFGFQDLLPEADLNRWYFYRPVSNLLTWKVGWLAWGLNPFPYHLIGLLLHAVAALALGLWLAEATGAARLGWLGGTLFGVFPLHMEAVGWLSAQWDVWAACFALTSLWLFTAWWRRANGGRLYALALLLYFLAVFSKENVLAFLPIFALSAWLVAERFNLAAWRRLLFAMLPFGAVLALNLGLRYMAWGRIGGYPNVPTDASNFFWNKFVTLGQLLLSPVSPELLGAGAGQVVARFLPWGCWRDWYSMATGSAACSS